VGVGTSVVAAAAAANEGEEERCETTDDVSMETLLVTVLAAAVVAGEGENVADTVARAPWGGCSGGCDEGSRVEAEDAGAATSTASVPSEALAARLQRMHSRPQWTQGAWLAPVQ
jgi:hypothetical protein